MIKFVIWNLFVYKFSENKFIKTAAKIVPKNTYAELITTSIPGTKWDVPSQKRKSTHLCANILHSLNLLFWVGSEEKPPVKHLRPLEYLISFNFYFSVKENSVKLQQLLTSFIQRFLFPIFHISGKLNCPS